jgi:Zn-dependent protease with chaperone function
MRLARVLVTTAVVVAGVLFAQAYVSRSTPAESMAEQAALHGPPAYTLPADKMQRAIPLGSTRRKLIVTDEVMLPAALLLLIVTGAAARMRDMACRLSRNRWMQGFGFVFLLLLAVQILSLPLQMWGHETGLRYGLSVQGWGSWFGDKAKMFALQWGIGGLLTMLLFRVIRKSPARWWLWFCMAAAGVTVAGIFISPYVIDPLFNKFEPLMGSDPALVAQLERVVARGGLSIPPERMFLMKASAKSTELNAYVTGFGASKRVVVWDTTVAKASPDEISFIFAHEMGHYALGHVVLGTTLQCVALLPLFMIGYYGLQVLLARYAGRWRIPSQDDWAALVVLLLILTTVSAVTDPLGNSFSRAVEHEADVYGQEAVHGIVAQPQGVGQRSFQVLGEDSLDDPTPRPVFDWWFSTHPPLWFRAGFAAAYDPWRPGEHPKYFVP